MSHLVGGCDGGKIARLPIVNGIVGGAEASQRPAEGAKTKLLAICCWDPPGGWGAKTRKAPLCKNNDNLLRVGQCATSTFCRKLESGFWGIGERETPLSLSLSLPLSLSSFSFHFLFLFPLSLPHWNVSLLSRNVKIRHLSRMPKIWTYALRGNNS